MNLLQRIIQPAPPTQERQLVELMSTMNGEKVERIGENFQGFVSRAYQDNGVVWAAVVARLVLFSQARFVLRNRRTKEIEDLPSRLQFLEEPFPGGTTAELLARVEQDTSLAGNYYVYAAEPDHWQRLRPDWIDIVTNGRQPIGYAYYEGGQRDKRPRILEVEKVAHGAPYPDPLKAFVGNSWLTAVVRDIMSDQAMNAHKLKYFENAAPQPLDAKILTPAGWTTMGDVGVGDRVVGSDGQSHYVTGVYPQGVQDIYRVTFSDGAVAECTLDHVWRVSNNYDRQRGVSRTMSLADLIADGFHYESGPAKWAVPMPDPIDYDTVEDLPLDPYLFGLLLGDGSFRSNGRGSGGITLASAIGDADETEQTIAPMLPTGVSITRRDRGGWSEFYFKGRGGPAPNPFTGIIKSLGLYDVIGGDKFIPDVYLHSSVKDRVGLLQGLIDSDGHIGVTGTVRFTTTSRQLADGLAELVGSLGGVTTVNPNKGRTTLTVLVRQLPDWIVPVRLLRKADRYRPSAALRLRTMVSAERVRSAESQCIRVESSDHLYITDGFILTHNTPNLLIKLQQTLNTEQKQSLQSALEQRHTGLQNAWKTMVLEGGADAQIIGSQFEEIAFDVIQAAGVERIAQASRVPLALLGTRQGNTTYSNYPEAVRSFADHTMQHLWAHAAGVFSQIVPGIPASKELWFDTRHISALQADAKDEAAIRQVDGSTIRTLTDAGFEPDTVVDAITTGDLRVLKGHHTGLLPVQLQKPGTTSESSGSSPNGAVVVPSDDDSDLDERFDSVVAALTP